MISGENLKVRDKIGDTDSWSEDESISSSSSESSLDLSPIIDDVQKPPSTNPSKNGKSKYNLKTQGELDIDDLPPIEELTISVKEDEMKSIGLVYAIIEKLVVVRSHKDERALDLDSVLFLTPDKPLGKVFDVFGPVGEPFYSIRFNDPEDICKKGVKVDAPVYFAPSQPEPITRYVFLEQLQRQKGSDASWRHNNEPPDQFLEFSDDEQERSARRNRRTENRTPQEDGSVQNTRKTGVCSPNKPPFVSQYKSFKIFPTTTQTSAANPFSIPSARPYQYQPVRAVSFIPQSPTIHIPSPTVHIPQSPTVHIPHPTVHIPQSPTVHIPQSPAIQFQNSPFWANSQQQGLNESIFQKSTRVSPAIPQTPPCSPFMPESQRCQMQPMFGSQPVFMFPNLQRPPPTFRYQPVFRTPPAPLSFHPNTMTIPVVPPQSQTNSAVPSPHPAPSPIASVSPLPNQNFFSPPINGSGPRVNWFQGRPVQVSPSASLIPSSLPTSTPLSVQIPNNSGGAPPAVGSFPVQFIQPSPAPVYLSRNNQPTFFRH